MIELSMMTLSIEGGLVRLDLSITPLSYILSIIDEAAGSGQWVAVEGFLSLSESDLA